MWRHREHHTKSVRYSVMKCTQRFKRPLDFRRSPLEIVDPETRMSRMYDEFVSIQLLGLSQIPWIH
jgi:hypothetical protein